jgi:predicted amidophosphoribosyltransferase
MLYKVLVGVEGALDGLRCQSCRARSGAGALCSDCNDRVRPAEGCTRCGRIDCPVSGGKMNSCEHLWFPYRRCIACVRYVPPVSDVILALKKSGSYRALRYCADRLIEAFPEAAAHVSLVTWVPSASAASKGFDHGELLAAAVSSSLSLPSANLLLRESRGEIKGLDRGGRLSAAARSFVGRDRIRKVSILLVDDVMTTGASLYHASLQLLRAGAREVYAIAVARTPLIYESLAAHRLCAGASDRHGSPRNKQKDSRKSVLG